jgi:hypothetical protein
LCAAADASSLPRHPQASAFGSKRLPSPGTAILAGAVFLVAAQLLRRAAAVSTADTNQSDRCATAHDQSRLWWGQTRGGGGRDRPAFPSPLRLISWPFASHAGALKGHLLSLNRPRRDERGGRCDGAISRLSSGCRRRCARCDGHNRFQHPGRIPDRVQGSYQTAVNASEAVRQSDE